MTVYSPQILLGLFSQKSVHLEYGYIKGPLTLSKTWRFCRFQMVPYVMYLTMDW